MWRNILVEIPKFEYSRSRETDSRFIETSLLTQLKDIRNENSGHVHVPWLRYVYRRKFRNNIYSSMDGSKKTESRTQKSQPLFQVIILCNMIVDSFTDYLKIQKYVFSLSFIIKYIYLLFILQSVLRQFSKQCDLVLPHSTSSILWFPKGHPTAAYVFFLVLLSIISFLLFNNVF